MKITKEIEKLEHSAARLTVTVAKEDVAKRYSETLTTYVKQAQLPGFRKGHVPPSVLERKYGSAIKQEAAADLIDTSLNEIFADDAEKANRPLPYAQPALEKMPELNVHEDFTYTVTYDVFPQVSVKDVSGITITEPQVTVGEQELAAELAGIQERNAVVIDKKAGESVEQGDIVTVNYSETGDDGKEIEGAKREGFVFTVGTGENSYGFDDDIIGMKKDETKQLTKTYAPDDTHEELAGKTKHITVTVTQIKVRNLPALDDELAQDVNEKFSTLDDLKADIKKSLESAKERKITELKTNDLLSQLIAQHPFEIPASMLQTELDSRWRMMAQQFQTTPQDLERMVTASGQTKEEMLTSWAGDAEKMLKSRIIVESLLRERNISVTPDEIEAEYVRIAESSGISVEDVKKRYADARLKEYLIDEAKEQKLYKLLFAEVKVTKGDNLAFADLFKQD